MIRATIFALLGATSLFSQTTSPEKYDSVKVTKVEVFYTLSSGEIAALSSAIDVKEGSEVKIVREGNSYSIIDSQGNAHKCQILIVDSALDPLPSKKKKRK